MIYLQMPNGRIRTFDFRAIITEDEERIRIERFLTGRKFYFDDIFNYYAEGSITMEALVEDAAVKAVVIGIHPPCHGAFGVKVVDVTDERS